ncbi:MAG: hypothetical protein KDA57_21680 [Planctomycetales bacterium]|nr:hypothetical protein [Planctomycetales bacterium]
MSDSEPLLVDCGPHGKRGAAVVCQHLLTFEGEALGFIENSDDPNDLQAWCGLCEVEFEREGEKTEAFRQFNDMRIVCVVCYEVARERHAKTS